MLPVPLAITAALATYGIVESRRHERALERIPLRIHVNGTRGKSSVTRLIAAGLRAGGRRTFAKTTGTLARLIRPDGSEVDVYRVGRPNVIEQTRVVRRAVEAGAEALVVECMAVEPELQPVAELRLIRSHIGVITNVRADHLDVMGPTVDDAAYALAQTLPVGGRAFTCERERLRILLEVARARRTTLEWVAPGAVSGADLAGFSYIEHAENLALALAVCGHLGVPREVALKGMQAAAPDPGVLRCLSVRTGAKEVEFVNAFAANDPDSTVLIWRRLGLDQVQSGRTRIVLASCRPDRVQRSEQIADLVARRISPDHVVLAGEGTGVVALRAIRSGLDRARIADLGGHDAEGIYQHTVSLVEDRGVVVGIGNIVGLGEQIAHRFRAQVASYD